MFVPVRMRHLTPLLLLTPWLVAGCYVKVDKSANGEGKDVEVHLPVGGVHVKQGPPSAEEMGLAAYPGATEAGTENNKSADVHVGFGDWQVNVRVAKYQSGDPQAKVKDFYRTALARFGDVIECRDGRALGSVSTTREGLSCSDKHSGAKGINIGDDDDGYSLRAGSRRHQHIVAVQAGANSGTRFTLVRLDLPGDHDDTSKEE